MPVSPLIQKQKKNKCSKNLLNRTYVCAIILIGISHDTTFRGRVHMEEVKKEIIKQLEDIDDQDALEFILELIKRLKD